MRPRSQGRLELAGAALLFSTGGAAIKAAQFTSWQVASLRSGVAAVALLAFLPAARRGWTWRVAPVGAAYAVTLTLYVLANKLTTAADTIFLQSTAPLYLLLLGPWLLREPVRPRDLGVMTALAAGLFCFFAGSERPVATAPDPVHGNLLAVLSGVTWALTVVGLRWMGLAEERGGGSPLAAVVFGNVLACLGGLPWALPLGAHALRDWTIIIYLGVFQIGLAYVFVTSGLRQLGALEASLILLIEPALNPVWSWAVHGEVPGPWAVAGGAVILGATTLKTWLDARDGVAPTPGAPSAESVPP
jgi:DME family drug/metabolite transporter